MKARRENATRRTLLWISLLLVAVGVGSSLYLTNLHVRVNTDPSFVAGCDISATFRCTDVALSRFSVFLGVPIAVWGLLGYGAFLFFLICGLRGDGRRPWPAGLYWLLNVVTLAATVVLAVIAEVAIGALCIGCIILYLINPLLFLGATWLLRQQPGALRRDLGGLSGNRTVVGFGACAAAASVALILAYPKYWELPLQAECGDLPAGIRADGSCWVGAREPVLEIVEFSDYRCPFCRRAHVRLRELVRQNKDRIRLVHKHFPLDVACNPMLQSPMHDQACLMARMAYCAGMQGEFWALNDILFAVPADKSVDPAPLAAEAGLDVASFLACLDTDAAAEHVQEDIKQGMALGITATPTFLIDGTQYVGQVPDEVIESALDGKAAMQ